MYTITHLSFISFEFIQHLHFTNLHLVIKNCRIYYCESLYSRANYEAMNEFLPNYNFNLLLMSSCWDLLKSGITSAISLFTHVYTLRHFHFPKWFTGDIQHQINCLRTLRRKKPTASHLIKSEGMESKLQEDIAIAKVGRSGFRISCSNTSMIFQHHNDLPTPQRSSNTTTIFQHHNDLPTPQRSFNTKSLPL